MKGKPSPTLPAAPPDEERLGLASPLTLSFARFSDRGRLPANQDRCFGRATSRSALVAVADGMGGYAGGEAASEAAIGVVEGLAAELDSAGAPAWLRTALPAVYARAVEAIRQRAASRPDWREMGTTLVCAAVLGNRLTVANVGDSRAYLLSGGGIRQLTFDHSALAEGLRDGTLTREHPQAAQLARALTRVLTIDDAPRVDVFPEGAEAWDLTDGDIVVLTSDGVHGVLPEDVIRSVFRNSSSLEAAAQYLGRLALAAGSRDNVTVAALAAGAWRRHGKELPPLRGGANAFPALRLVAALSAVVLACLVVAAGQLLRSQSKSAPPPRTVPAAAGSTPTTSTVPEGPARELYQGVSGSGGTGSPQRAEGPRRGSPTPGASGRGGRNDRKETGGSGSDRDKKPPPKRPVKEPAADSPVKNVAPQDQ